MHADLSESSGSRSEGPDGAVLDPQLSQAVNPLDVGPHWLGGEAASFALHVELAADITMYLLAANMQCHRARRAGATIDAAGVRCGF